VHACENSMQEGNDLGKKRASVDIAENVTSYMSQGALVKAKLTAPLMTHTEGGDSSIIEFPKTLQVEFYNDSTKQESHLFARYGKYLERQGKVFLRDSVIVFNMAKGDTLVTDELWWDKNKEIFYTDKFVLIKQKDRALTTLSGLDRVDHRSAYMIKRCRLDPDGTAQAAFIAFSSQYVLEVISSLLLRVDEEVLGLDLAGIWAGRAIVRRRVCLRGDWCYASRPALRRHMPTCSGNQLGLRQSRHGSHEDAGPKVNARFWHSA